MRGSSVQPLETIPEIPVRVISTFATEFIYGRLLGSGMLRHGLEHIIVCIGIPYFAFSDGRNLEESSEDFVAVCDSSDSTSRYKTPSIGRAC